MLGILGIVVIFGLSIAAMAYSISNISGSHINPAVSLAMLINKKIGVKDFGGYIIARFIGGIIGAALLKAIISMTSLDHATVGIGTNGFDSLSFVGLVWCDYR